MTRYTVRTCRFDTTLDITGKKRTYEAIKKAVVEAGRFSVFEATGKDSWRFAALHRDPKAILALIVPTILTKWKTVTHVAAKDVPKEK